MRPTCERHGEETERVLPSNQTRVQVAEAGNWRKERAGRSARSRGQAGGPQGEDGARAGRMKGALMIQTRAEHVRSQLMSPASYA